MAASSARWPARVDLTDARPSESVRLRSYASIGVIANESPVWTEMIEIRAPGRRDRQRHPLGRPGTRRLDDCGRPDRGLRRRVDDPGTERLGNSEAVGNRIKDNDVLDTHRSGDGHRTQSDRAESDDSESAGAVVRAVERLPGSGEIVGEQDRMTGSDVGTSDERRRGERHPDGLGLAAIEPAGGIVGITPPEELRIDRTSPRSRSGTPDIGHSWT